MPVRSAWLPFLAALAGVVAALGWLLADGDSRVPIATSVRSSHRTAPRLVHRAEAASRGAGPQVPPARAADPDEGLAGESESPPDPEPPPPDVFAQVDAPPPRAVALRIHVLMPWGDLPHRELGFPKTVNWGGGARWSIDRPEDCDTGDPALPNSVGGSIDPDGDGALDDEALTRWERWPLVITAPFCRPVVLERPPRPLPATLVVRAVPDEDTVRFRGRVRDDRGRPLDGAGVFLADAPWIPGARTTSEGAFDLVVPSGTGAREEDDLSFTPLVAVAPGFLATPFRARPGGEDGLDVTLDRDEVHARWELRFLRADGTPAAGARAWAFPATSSFHDEIWDRRERTEGREADTRRFLPRVVGGAAVDEQGYEIGQDWDGILDLVADADGRLVLPAVTPGTWRVRAALGSRTADDDHACQPDVYEVHVREVAEATVDVAAPPTVTRTEVRLAQGRSVTGVIRVAVNPAWHCDHTDHVHFVRVDDWMWSQVRVQSGTSEWAGRTTTFTGRFRLDGVPRSACRLVVATYPGHPDVKIDLPPLPDSATAPVDLGTIVVPDARTMRVEIEHPDGSANTDWKGEIRLEGVPDVGGPWSSQSASLDFMLPTPPPSTASVVARVPGELTPVAVVRAPFVFASDRPVGIRVADPPPGAGADPAADAGGDAK